MLFYSMNIIIYVNFVIIMIIIIYFPYNQYNKYSHSFYGNGNFRISMLMTVLIIVNKHDYLEFMQNML